MNKKTALKSSLMAGATTVISVPAFAQDATSVQQVNDSVSTIATAGGAAVAIAVSGLAVRLAIKQVNRLMTKA